MLVFTNSGCLLPIIIGINRSFLQSTPVTSYAIRNYAARKGTRERKRKAKVKVEVEKVKFIPHNLRDKEEQLRNRRSLKFDDSKKSLPVDNVFIQKYYKYVVYPFAEAVKCHRETHHPEIYNQPNAELHVSIELNMQGEKKTRFIDNFTRIAPVPHRFDHGEERKVLAFTKIPEMQEEARSAGALLAGGAEIVKQIQNGAVSLQDFDFVVAHPGILPELVPLRGLMKKRFPNPKSGSLDVDVPALVNRFMSGVKYSAVRDEYQKDFGLIKTVIGTLNMDAQHLEENFEALVQDVYKVKPKREGSFIIRCLLISPPSREKLKVDHSLYLDGDAEEESDEEEATAAN